MILVCGYYHRHNLGDDAFAQVLPRFFPDAELEFCTIDELPRRGRAALARYDALVVGGGDLINDYFYKALLPAIKAYRTLERGPVLALGVGLPHPELVEQGYLDCFDHVFVRAKRDVRAVQRRLGSAYAHYLPDLAFALEPLEPPSAPSAPAPAPAVPQVGVCLVHAVASQPAVLDALVQLCWKLSKRYQLVLYRFDSSRKPDQDDGGVNAALQDRLTALALQKHKRARHAVLLNGSVWTPDRLLAELQRCELAICMRFHAHVFAAIAGVPFLSIGDTRKVEQLLADLELAPLGVACAPTSSAELLLHAFGRVAQTAPQLRAHLRSAAAAAAFQLATAQPRQLLAHSRRAAAPAETLAFAQGQQRLEREAHGLAAEFAALLREHGADRVAELLCWRLTRNPHSAYLHGMREQMRALQQQRGLASAVAGAAASAAAAADQLAEMIKWVKLDLQQRLGGSADRLLDLRYISQEVGSGVHRSGWQYCLDYLGALQGDKGLLCDAYLDRSFHWAKALMLEHGLLPYTSPWIGFLHHTPSDYSPHNAARLVECDEFRRSLPTCRGLVCLSDSLAAWLRTRVPPAVRVIALQHPTECVGAAAQWRRNRFLGNAQRRLVQVGGWYRNPWTIHTLRAEQLALFAGKAALRGRAMDAYFAPLRWVLQRRDGRLAAHALANQADQALEDAPSEGVMCRASANKWLHYLVAWLEASELLAGLPPDFEIKFGAHRKPRHALRPLYAELKRMIRSVERIDWLDEAGYDRLLAENVVFLDLVDCAACNTLIECIVRCTPVVVTRLPAVQEYLGADYPLYWPAELSLDAVTRAHKYLRRLDKSRLRVSHFVDALRSSLLA